MPAHFDLPAARLRTPRLAATALVLALAAGSALATTAPAQAAPAAARVTAAQPATQQAAAKSAAAKSAAKPAAKPAAKQPNAALTAQQIARVERAVLAHTNAHRKRAGVPLLRRHKVVEARARAWSRALAATSSFQHDGFGWLRGVRAWRTAGENIALNRGASNPAAMAIESWLNSPDHRRNMLDPRYRYIGVGVAHAPDGTVYFTQRFYG